jgi:hypothetical protein
LLCCDGFIRGIVIGAHPRVLEALLGGDASVRVKDEEVVEKV